MHQTFQYCVNLLQQAAHLTDMSYEAINIWIFVIIHPAITLLLAGTAWNYIIQNRNARRELSKLSK